MREILFRGKRKDSGEWIDGGLCIINKSPFICYEMAKGLPKLTEVEENTIGQYTGLTDKNGEKIFEGDILIINNQHKYPVLVKFIDFSWTCVIPNNNAYLNYRHRLENNLTKYEIIGNIHDNPELLGDK